ncbi:MAG: POTRA domain-containing protein [Candidatus Cloacimonadales bacterium]
MKYSLLSLILFLLLPLGAAESETVVGEIVFRGNNYFSAEELQQAVSLRTGDLFSMAQVTNSAQKLAKYYENAGYLNVVILQPQLITENAQQVGVIFQIEERGQLKVRKIEFIGNNYLNPENFPQYSSEELAQIPDYLAELVEYSNRQGFLFAAVQLREIAVEGQQVDLLIELEEGEYCEFEKIRIRGNKVSQPQSLIRISGLKREKLLTTRDFQQAENRLLAKSYIKEAAVFPLNSRELLIDISEDRMTLFSGIVGFDDTAEEKLTGYFDLDFLNLWGTDRALSFFWQRLSNQNETLEMSYHESGFYDIPLNADLSLFREQADSTFIRNSVDLEIFYYRGNHKYGLYLARENILPGGRQDAAQILRRDYTKIGGSWLYDSLDYAENPSSGWQSKLKFYNIFQQAEIDINRNAVETLLANAFSLRQRWVIFSQIQAKLMENKNLSSVDYWKLGGFKDLRGFMEDNFYGYHVGSINLELRYLLTRRSRFFIFADQGYAQNDQYTKGKLFAVGLGLRLQTNLGVLGIDYGLGFSDGQWRSPMNGIIHFGIETKL